MAASSSNFVVILVVILSLSGISQPLARKNSIDLPRRLVRTKIYLKRLRGGLNLPLSSKDPFECDTLGVFHWETESEDSEPGDELEVVYGVKSVTHEWKKRRPRIPPNGDPRQIMVQGLPSKLSQRGVYEYFAEYGDVLDIQMPLDQETGFSKGVAFISFKKPIEAELAIWDVKDQAPFGKEYPLEINYASKEEFDKLTEKQLLPGRRESQIFDNLNEQALGKIGAHTYEDFMLQSRSESEGDDPREVIHRNMMQSFKADQLPEGTFKRPEADPDAPRLFPRGPGDAPVSNQEMVEGILGARKGMLDPMFKGVEEDEERIRHEQEDMVEGFGSGFDGKEGRFQKSDSYEDYGYAAENKEVADIPSEEQLDGDADNLANVPQYTEKTLPTFGFSPEQIRRELAGRNVEIEGEAPKERKDKVVEGRRITARERLFRPGGPGPHI
ncbi:hypothetical protein AAMO2058_001359300 [Amorphochlora amoebiformis]